MMLMVDIPARPAAIRRYITEISPLTDVFLSVNLYSFISGCAGSLLLLSGFLYLR
jgi:hypothetical protein